MIVAGGNENQFLTLKSMSTKDFLTKYKYFIDKLEAKQKDDGRDISKV